MDHFEVILKPIWWYLVNFGSFSIVIPTTAEYWLNLGFSVVVGITVEKLPNFFKHHQNDFKMTSKWFKSAEIRKLFFWKSMLWTWETFCIYWIFFYRWNFFLWFILSLNKYETRSVKLTTSPVVTLILFFLESDKCWRIVFSRIW